MIDRQEVRRERTEPTLLRLTCGEELVVPFGGGDYEIYVKGRLSDSLLATFEGLTPTVEPAQMVLYGPVRGQVSLHGLLERLQSLGFDRDPAASCISGRSSRRTRALATSGERRSGLLIEIERLAHLPGCMGDPRTSPRPVE
jgi:hypothetical protein